MMNSFDFKASEAFLASLQKFGIKLGLEQTEEVSRRCGNPGAKLRYLHLAGTNGKGSTGALLERALRANGFTTGFYSSPHLLSVRERIRVNGQAVSEEDFTRAAELVKSAAEAMKAEGSCPTYFEAMTVMAMKIFADAHCDYVVWETGMGGRLDSTNVVTPIVSIITGIAFDHQQYLGNTLAAIAGEKAGIIKRGVPVVVGVLPPEAEAVIAAKAAELDAPLVRASEAFPLGETLAIKPNFQEFVCGGETLNLQLNGVMQQRNAQLARAVLETIHLWNDASRHGFAETRWPARIEICAQGRVLVDGGHNPDGLTALTEALRRLYPGKKFRWVFGAFADKDFAGGLALIAPLAESLEAVAFAEGTRLSAAPEEICRAAKKLNIETVSGKRRLPEILNNAINSPVPETPLVVAGSLYLAGEALQILDAPERVWNI